MCALYLDTTRLTSYFHNLPILNFPVIRFGECIRNLGMSFGHDNPNKVQAAAKPYYHHLQWHTATLPIPHDCHNFNRKHVSVVWCGVASWVEHCNNVNINLNASSISTYTYLYIDNDTGNNEDHDDNSFYHRRMLCVVSLKTTTMILPET